jgi:hypothetical protein
MRHGKTLACYPGVPAAYYGTESEGCMTLVDLKPGKAVNAVAYTLGPRARRRGSAS